MSIAWETYCGVTPVNKVLVQLSGTPGSLARRTAGGFPPFGRKDKEPSAFYDGQVLIITS